MTNEPTVTMSLEKYENMVETIKRMDEALGRYRAESPTIQVTIREVESDLYSSYRRMQIKLVPPYSMEKMDEELHKVLDDTLAYWKQIIPQTEEGYVSSIEESNENLKMICRTFDEEIRDMKPFYRKIGKKAKEYMDKNEKEGIYEWTRFK